MTTPEVLTLVSGIPFTLTSKAHAVLDFDGGPAADADEPRLVDWGCLHCGATSAPRPTTG